MAAVVVVAVVAVSSLSFWVSGCAHDAEVGGPGSWEAMKVIFAYRITCAILMQPSFRFEIWLAKILRPVLRKRRMTTIREAVAYNVQSCASPRCANKTRPASWPSSCGKKRVLNPIGSIRPLRQKHSQQPHHHTPPGRPARNTKCA